MSINDEVISVLVKEIHMCVKNISEKLNFDRTYIGIVSAVNSDGYTIKYNGTDIKIKTSANNVLKVNDVVKFCVPCGNKRKAFIVADLDLILKIKNE